MVVQGFAEGSPRSVVAAHPDGDGLTVVSHYDEGATTTYWTTASPFMVLVDALRIYDPFQHGAVAVW
jgi:hypothetical protein